MSSNWTSDDIDGTAIHELNVCRGLVALQNGDVKQVRRYLLSASFGLPKDPLVHLWLGQVYQKTHQLQRAWAQFIEASLAQDPPIDAIIELAAVMRDPSFRAGFGAADAELILEGRVPSFWPDESRQPDQRPAVQLVEFFSDANNSRTVGGQLAFDGLREFFTGTPVVFICYHLEAQLINDTCRERVNSTACANQACWWRMGRSLVTNPGRCRRQANCINNICRIFWAAPIRLCRGRWNCTWTPAFAPARYRPT